MAATCGSVALGAALGATGPVAIPAVGPWIIAVDGWPVGIDACTTDPTVDYAVTALSCHRLRRRSPSSPTPPATTSSAS
ncbi:hypothetical protein NKG05_30410 [Oerskovia sp. M15]